LAGACFALAFGNRTELILTGPVYLYWWIFPDQENQRDRPSPRERLKSTRDREPLRERWQTPARFLAIPIALGLATAAYNFVRFGSIFDFGYALIPNLITEPWYHHGLFSFSAIPWNVYTMLFEGMRDIPEFPFLQPDPFGCSIFLASPFLFLPFSRGRETQADGLAGYRLAHSDPLVPRQSGRLAVLLSLRHDSAPVDVSPPRRQRAAPGLCH
jgi:hypothetical protein